MRIVDENMNELVNPDLTIGRLDPAVIIRPDAELIDNITKHAWADEDYESVYIYHLYTQAELDAIESEKNKKSEAERITALEVENAQLKEALDLLLSGATEEAEADG